MSDLNVGTVNASVALSAVDADITGVLKVGSAKHPDSGTANITMHSDGSTTFGGSIDVAGSFSPFNLGNNVVLNAANANEFTITANNNTVFKLDASGYMTLPYQPYFHANRTGHGDEGGNQFMTYPNIVQRRPDSTGWFDGTYATAPVDGVYAFFMQRLTPNNGNVVDNRWRVNGGGGAAYGGGYSGNWSGHKQCQSHLCLFLNAGDTVATYNINGGTTCCSVHNIFIGFKVS